MIESEEETGHIKRKEKPDRISKLEKRIEKVEALRLNIAEFIFQAVSLIVGLIAIIFALLIGIPAYQKISDISNAEIIRKICILNNLLIFLIIVMTANIVVQILKWKR